MKNLTKEALLAKRIISFGDAHADTPDMTDEAIKRNVYAVMDQYAIQQATEFLEWAAGNMMGNYPYQQLIDGTWATHVDSDAKTTEDLYKEFALEKSKK